jgi:Protein of unknown function (DUF2950)
MRNYRQDGNDPPKGLQMTKHSLFIAICALSSVIPFYAGGQTQPSAATPSKTVGQTTFPSPQAAVESLIKATRDYDVPALMRIFGPDGKDFISSADPVRDKNASVGFADLAQKGNVIKPVPNKPNQVTLIVGDDDWPFPIPLVKQGGKWRFDSQAGRTEILFRRIGTNELDAIQVCRGFVEAQNEYSLTLHDGSTLNQYAQRLLSSPGKQNGLYWKNSDGTSGGPISEAIVKAIDEGYTFEKLAPFHGYYFKVLKGQGAAAPLGRLDYVIDGAMIGGFALVAVPAQYRVTGVKTFIVSQDGVVYQKDLGSNSLKIAKDMELFNPDTTWEPTDDDWPAETASTDTTKK